MDRKQFSDKELMARVARRERAAFEALYDRYSPKAMGLALKLVGEPNLAEEIVQEAFWRVWKRAKTYSTQRGEFSTWLFGIVHNLAIDELRRQGSRPRLVTGEWTDESVLNMPDLKADVAETAHASLVGDHVRAALHKLPQAQRRLVELAFFQGFTHREIAEKLGQPIGTIHTHMRQALLALRELLTPLRVNGYL